DRLKDAEELAGLAGLRDVKLMLPHDVVIADAVSETANVRVVKAHEVPESTKEEQWRIFDIGPETAEAYGEAIRQARTVVWNGPMGVFEMAPFAEGTRRVAQAVCDATRGNGATSIVGGGDSVAAVEQMGLADCITHISTGGGASLEFLEGQTLPGVAALRDRE
ncbi:MAG TPA: phosphoglycerate kinase, partial [Chloroflexia bacterium]|nr:phosphoglycerate kinase [Chloroflexia bacterium]